MSILPESVNQDYGAQISEYPSDTWIIADGRIVGRGKALEAMRQAVDVILNVERYRHQIYSINFGAELNSLVGRETEYVESMLKRRLSEALLADKRILSVSNFTFEQKGLNELLCSFDVRTVYGVLRREVEY